MQSDLVEELLLEVITAEDGQKYVSTASVAQATGLNYSNLANEVNAIEPALPFQMVARKKYVQAGGMLQVLESFNENKLSPKVDRQLLTDIKATLKAWSEEIRPFDPDAASAPPTSTFPRPSAVPAPIPQNPEPAQPPAPNPRQSPKPALSRTYTNAPELQLGSVATFLETVGSSITFFLKSLVFLYVMYTIVISIEAYLQADLFGILLQPSGKPHNILEPRPETWLMMPLTVILQLCFAILDVNQLTGKETISIWKLEVRTINLALAFVFVFNLFTSEFRMFHGIAIDPLEYLAECFIRALYGAVIPVTILVLGFMIGKRTQPTKK